MAGQKLSSKTEEEIVFMQNMLLQCDGLTRKVEEYAACKTKAVDAMVQQIIRQLSQFRQQAMSKNLARGCRQLQDPHRAHDEGGDPGRRAGARREESPDEHRAGKDGRRQGGCGAEDRGHTGG